MKKYDQAEIGKLMVQYNREMQPFPVTRDGRGFPTRIKYEIKYPKNRVIAYIGKPTPKALLTWYKRIQHGDYVISRILEFDRCQILAAATYAGDVLEDGTRPPQEARRNPAGVGIAWNFVSPSRGFIHGINPAEWMTGAYCIVRSPTSKLAVYVREPDVRLYTPEVFRQWERELVIR